MTEHAPIERPPKRWKLRIEDFLLLDDTGAFGASRRTELIDGEVYVMSPLHVPHARIVSRLHVHQFWAPDGEDYGGVRAVPFRRSITAVTIDGLVVETASL